MSGDSKKTCNGVMPGTAAPSASMKTTLGLLPMIALSAALTGPAAAQEPGGDIPIDEVSVLGAGGETGYKRDQVSSRKATAPILNTPQTVTVIPEEIIEERGATNLTEVLRNTPGISFEAGENGFATNENNFQMRGFDASGDIFIDGTRSSGSFARDVFNIEQVEVVKGAASDNGRGGPGGYINLVTKTPVLRDFIHGSAGVTVDEHGTDPFKRGTVDINQQLNDLITVRLNTMLEDGGFMGRDTANKRAWGLAPSVALGLGTDFRAIFAYEHVSRDDLPDWGVPAHTIPGTFNYDPIAAQARRDAFYGLVTDKDKVRSNAAMARFEYDFNEAVSISNQTRWSNVDRKARFTHFNNGGGPLVGFPPQVPTTVNHYQRENMSVTNLTDLRAQFLTGSFLHTLSTGVEFSHETADASRYGTVNPPLTSIFNPNPYRLNPGPWPNPTQTSKVKVNTVAAYLFDTIEINEQWQLTGGLRAERYKVDIDSKTAAGLPQGPDGYSATHTTLGGRVGLVYKPVREGSLYASYGVSTLPPGSLLSNPDISRTGDNAFPGFVPGAKPMQSHNYEVGAKWDFFGGNLHTAVALFHTEKHNAPITGRDVGDTVTSLKGYGKQTVQGIELHAAGKITPEWSVFGGLTLLRSERRHSAYLDDVRRRANPGDYGATLRTSGDELAFTPNVTANLWSTYRFHNGITIGGGVQYVGESWVGRPADALRIIPNGTFGKQPSYFLAHAMVAYELTDKVTLRFNVDNIFDKHYASSLNWNATRAMLGAPRTFRLTTSFDL